MTAIERGCPYSLTDPTGLIIASFNVPTDPNFCGYMTDVTGLDMYGVRENAQVNAAGDGGYHGPFWRDRRPFTLTGFVMPTIPVLNRDQAQDKILSVVAAAFRSDSLLNWTPADGIQRAVYFRVQQPLRYTKGQSNIEQNFLIAGVSRVWQILQMTQSSSSATGTTPLSLSVSGTGNADAAPIFTVTGPVTSPVIYNTTTGKKFSFTGGTSVPAGQTAVVDLTGVYPSILINGSDSSNLVDPLNTDYTIAVSPGTNAYQLQGTGSSAATALRIAWHNSWH